MPSRTQTTDRPDVGASSGAAAAAGSKGRFTPNQKLVGRILRKASADHELPNGRPARMQRPEAVAAINKIMMGLFPDVDLSAINGGLLDERELGRYERGEVHWPSRYRRAAMREFFEVSTDKDLGFYRSQTLEPVLDDDEQAAAPAVTSPDHQGARPRHVDASGNSQSADPALAVGGDGDRINASPPIPTPRSPATGSSTLDGPVKVRSGGTPPVSPLGRSGTVDVTKPHPARVYQYWLGGKDNFAADRAFADAILEKFPWVATAARANRDFLGRAVRVVAQAGVRQFLDIGTGLPAPGNTHEVAQQVTPQARVLYVDNDPIVMVHSRALSVGNPAGRTAYIEADVRRPEDILGDPVLTQTLNLDEPVCVVLAAVLHFIPDLSQAQQVVRTLLDAVPPGSFLIVSHGTPDFVSAEEAEEYERMYASGAAAARTRTKEEIESFFTGLQVLAPGLVAVSEWRPADRPDQRPKPNHVSLYGAVGRVA